MEGITVSFIDLLYPHRCRTDASLCPTCPEPVTLIVCLPGELARHPATLLPALAAAVRPHAATAGAILDGGHFPLWYCPNDTEQSLLLLAHPDPVAANLTWCAGGPIGLLEIDAAPARLAPFVADAIEEWTRTAGAASPATPWWTYHDAHQHNPAGYPLATAIGDFTAQPPVAAMPAQSYPADMYGPGLQAIQAGADTLADYLAGQLTFGDGLVDLHGGLLAPAFSTGMVDQSLAERALYHRRARRYLRSLHPSVVLAAVGCERPPTITT
jgi:hypothetical protein